MLFDVIATAYDWNSVLVTTNLLFQNWTKVLGNERLTGVAQNCLTHRCHILETKGAPKNPSAAKAVDEYHPKSFRDTNCSTSQKTMN